MTRKTSNTDNKFHINLSNSGRYADIYKSFLEYEPIEPSHSTVSDGNASSDTNKPQVVSQDTGLPTAPQIPEIQETTYQVPCGVHSIFDPAHKVPGFEKAVYLKVNEHSNWETGVSHALSLRRLAKLLNVKSHSQVHRGLQWLIENGWLKIEGKRESDGAYIYRVVHHKCDPVDTPVDKDGRPQKCAVPRGKGSLSQLLAEGEITWKIFVDWTTRKVHSCWTSGFVSMAVREASKLMKFTAKTVSENAKKMLEIGLLKRLSAKFRLSEYQMFPKPYPDRRERTPEVCITKKAMKLINGWYYSFNGLWRFEKETFRLQMCEHDGRWIESTLEKLYSKNKSIYRDFRDYMRQLSELYGTPLLT